jgi:hypothetical protein
MNSSLLGTIAAVLAAWLVLLFIIRRWPVRVLRRNIICPVQDTSARVTFLRSERGFGNMVVTDVSKCSLFPDGGITCERRCVH